MTFLVNQTQTSITSIQTSTYHLTDIYVHKLNFSPDTLSLWFSNNVWNLFNINNKNTKATSLTSFWSFYSKFWSNFRRCSISIVNFEPVNVDWSVLLLRATYDVTYLTATSRLANLVTNVVFQLCLAKHTPNTQLRGDMFLQIHFSNLNGALPHSRTVKPSLQACSHCDFNIAIGNNGKFEVSYTTFYFNITTMAFLKADKVQWVYC